MREGGPEPEHEGRGRVQCTRRQVQEHAGRAGRCTCVTCARQRKRETLYKGAQQVSEQLRHLVANGAGGAPVVTSQQHALHAHLVQRRHHAPVSESKAAAGGCGGCGSLAAAAGRKGTHAPKRESHPGGSRLRLLSSQLWSAQATARALACAYTNPSSPCTHTQAALPPGLGLDGVHHCNHAHQRLHTEEAITGRQGQRAGTQGRGSRK